MVTVIRQRVVLTFPATTTDEPVTWRLVVECGLWMNILRAEVDPGNQGRLLVELKGSEDQMSAGMKLLQELAITVEPLTDKLTVDRDLCLDCGACTGVCIAGALALDDTDRLEFLPENCILCQLCLQACPVQALATTF